MITYRHPLGGVFPLTLDSLKYSLGLSGTQRQMYFSTCQLMDRDLQVWDPVDAEALKRWIPEWAEVVGPITVTLIEPPKETLLKAVKPKPSLFKDRPAPRLGGL